MSYYGHAGIMILLSSLSNDAVCCQTKGVSPEFMAYAVMIAVHHRLSSNSSDSDGSCESPRDPRSQHDQGKIVDILNQANNVGLACMPDTQQSTAITARTMSF